MVDIAMDGPVIEGTWYNAQTGDSFTVRDSFFQDSQLIIQATDGRMFDYNTIQNYVKSSSPIPKQPSKSQAQRSIPKEVSGIIEPDILDDDLALINGAATNVPTTPTPQPSLSEDEIIINRILSRVQEPTTTHNIDWIKFPHKQLEMLIDMMGVEVSDVAKYFVNKIDLEAIKETLQKQIESDIIKHLNLSISTSIATTEEESSTKLKGSKNSTNTKPKKTNTKK